MPGSSVAPVLEIVIIAILVIFAGGFTTAEAAILTLLRASRAQQREDEDDYLPELEETAREELPAAVKRLADHPGRLTATITFGRLVARVLSVAATALLAWRWAIEMRALHPWLWVVIGVLITVFLLLLLAEVLPRIVGTRRPHMALAWTVPLLAVAMVLLLPVTVAGNRVLRRFARSEHGEPAFLTLEELNRHLEARTEAGTLEAEDREMIEDLLEFGETMVREVMVPRIDIRAVGVNASYDEVHAVVAETGHSRLPVFDGDLDHIVGIMHVKDLLRRPEGEEVPIRQVMRKALFVPGTKMIDDLLREFQQTRRHMAIVVDEYGGTSGLVTLEDLLEEIVGEIQDEYDREMPLVKEISPGVWDVNAIIDLEDLEDATGIKVPEDGWDTLGGFIYSLEGRVPEAGHVYEWEGHRFRVLEIEGRRIIRVEISRADTFTGTAGEPE